MSGGIKILRDIMAENRTLATKHRHKQSKLYLDNTSMRVVLCNSNRRHRDIHDVFFIMHDGFFVVTILDFPSNNIF